MSESARAANPEHAESVADAEIRASSLGHLPSAQWAFDEAVTKVFDDMLERSIPGYATMRRVVTELGAHYVKRDTAIVDLGCSRGGALAPFVERFGAANLYVGVETSPPMLAAARARFDKLIRAGVVDIIAMDLRDQFPRVRASLVLSVLTLMFVPNELRLDVLSRVYNALIPGGALLIVEKVVGATAEINARLVESYHGFKAASGYSTEEIERKRLALQGVLMPFTARFNEELLRASGFAQVDCVWRELSFCAWLAIK